MLAQGICACQVSTHVLLAEDDAGYLTYDVMYDVSTHVLLAEDDRTGICALCG